MPGRPLLPHRRFLLADTDECVLGVEVRRTQGPARDVRWTIAYMQLHSLATTLGGRVTSEQATGPLSASV
jgi:hypothetical protein